MTKTNEERGTFNVIIKFQTKKYTTIDGKKVICPGYGEPILFWDDFNFDGSGNYVTTCFTMSESHGTASLDYYSKECHPPFSKEEKQKANKLFKWYLNYCKQPQFDGEPLPVRKQKRSNKRS